MYCYSSAALEVFQEARRLGIRCVLDHATAPKDYEDGLVAAEWERFAAWWPRPADDAAAERYARRQREECRLADRIVCGSSYLKRVIEANGGPADKALVVPLGLMQTPGCPARDVRHDGPLHALFIGNNGLLKGLGDLARAAELVGRCAEVRAVGDIRPTAEGRRCLARCMKLVGSVPRSEISGQYRWADVLVLPSVSDTFALVILEAMAYGVPVIATPNSGAPDVLTEGREGFIVPIRSPEAIAGFLERLRADRALLEEMGRNARRKSLEYTGARYAASLAAAVSGRGRVEESVAS